MQLNRAMLVDGSAFEDAYQWERTDLWHADYLGQKDGHHFLAVYTVGSGDFPRYRYSLCAPASELPLSFPKIPQKPMRHQSSLTAPPVFVRSTQPSR